MTQLPLERACPPRASLACGDALGTFTVQAHDSCGARAGSADSLACSLQVICEGLDPSKAAFPISAAGVAVVEGGRSSPAHCLVMTTGHDHAQCMHMQTRWPGQSLSSPWHTLPRHLQELDPSEASILISAAGLARRTPSAMRHMLYVSLSHTPAGGGAEAAIAAAV